MMSYLLISLISAWVTSSAATIANTSMELQDVKEMYSSKPTEILPIQPTLIYPSDKKVPYQGRALFKDNKIIYVKLLNRKNYRPKSIKNKNGENQYTKDIQMEDIFYVKSLTNGQFSQNRLKLYRLPEFYAIAIYKKGYFKQ